MHTLKQRIRHIHKLSIPKLAGEKTVQTILSRLFLFTSIFLITSNLLVDGEIVFIDLAYLLLISSTFSLIVYLLIMSTKILFKKIPENVIKNILNLLIINIFIVTIFSPSDFGLLNGTVGIRKFTTSQYFLDFIRLFLSAILSIYLFILSAKKKFPLVKIIASITLILCVFYTISNSYNNAKLLKIQSWDFLGKEKNIIVIIADGLQGSFADEVFNKNPILKGKYSGFTFYNKAISPHVYTSFALPAIMSGTLDFHDKYESTSEINLAAKNDNFIIDSINNGFVAYEFPYSIVYSYSPTNQFNLTKSWSQASLNKYLKLAISRNAPLLVSKQIIVTGNQNGYFSSSKEIAVDFYEKFSTLVSIGQESNSLIFHHSMLPHAPIYYDENGRVNLDGEQTYNAALNEVTYTLSEYSKLFNKLKSVGSWDNSLIIIIADHGSAYKFREDELSFVGNSYYSIASYNPAILIKYPYNQIDFPAACCGWSQNDSTP